MAWLLLLTALPCASPLVAAPRRAPFHALRPLGTAPAPPRRHTALLGARSSLNARINAYGLSLKDKGARQRDLMREATSKAVKLQRFAAMATIFTTFVGYRAYRGFFVVLPAVYGEVFNRAKDEHFEFNGVEVTDDIDPATGQLRLRSRILMNVFSLLFVASLAVTKFVGFWAKALALLNPPETPEARLAKLEAELDLPPLPDIPDLPPDTDDFPVPL